MKRCDAGDQQWPATIQFTSAGYAASPLILQAAKPMNTEKLYTGLATQRDCLWKTAPRKVGTDCPVTYSSWKIPPGNRKIFVLMNDYRTEKWYDLYKTAMLELERAAISGRIGDARAEITTRLETLQQHPNLHHTELSAIRDAINNLRVLEREEERLAAEDKKRILQQTVQSLKTIAPKFGEPDQQ